jgi:hypothetical protein
VHILGIEINNSKQREHKKRLSFDSTAFTKKRN